MLNVLVLPSPAVPAAARRACSSHNSTMSSRRTSRRAPKKAAASLPAGVLAGLSSLVEGNESTIAQMLSVTDLPSDRAEAQTQLQTSLTDCMAMNDLSAEALLARFFDSSVLSRYCQDRLGVSGKGNEATLAARIARAWAKLDFEPLPLAPSRQDTTAKRSKDSKKKQAKRSSEGGSEKTTETTKTANVAVPRKKKQKVASAENSV